MSTAAAAPTSDISVALRNLAKLGSSLGLTLVIGFLIRPLLRRTLGPDAFGPIDAADGFTATWFVALSLGLEAYIRKEIPTRPEHANDFFASTTGLRVLMTIPIFIGMELVMRSTNRPMEVRLLVYVLGVAQFFVYVNSTFAALLQSNTTVDGLSVSNVLSKILWATGSVVGVLAGFGLMSIAISQLASELVKAAIGWHLCRKHLKLKLSGFGWGPTKIIVLATLPYYLNGIFHTIYNKIDVFVLSVVAGNRLGTSGGNQETAWYGASSAVGGMSMLGMPLIFGVLMPLLARAHAGERAEYERLVRRSLEIILIVAIPVSLALGVGADTFIQLMFGQAYAQGAVALRLLSPIYVAVYVSVLTAVALQIEGRSWTMMCISLGALTLNLTANFLIVGAVLDTYGAGYGGAACGLVQVITEGTVALVMLGMMGKRSFDRRTVIMLVKTLFACGAVVGFDLFLRSNFTFDTLRGLFRVVLDGLLYAALVLGLRAVNVREVVGFLKQARQGKREQATT